MDNHKLAQTMRRQADGLSKQIEKKLHPAIADQNPTPRRQRIAAGMFEDGRRLGQTQNVLYAMADLIETGTVPAPLRGVTSRKDVEQVLFSFCEIYSDDFMNGIIRAGHEMAIQMSGAEAYAERKRKMELYQAGINLIGVVPGFFPTPMKVAKRMIDWAGHLADEVFDPSAGSGAILDAVWEVDPGCARHGIEYNSTLAALCQEKGHEVYQGDIFNTPVPRQYETILMNPPFESSGASLHTTYVFNNWLAPGGTLIAITDSMAMRRKDKAAQDFADLIDSYGEYEDLPAGSFKESLTGVNTCIVRLKK